MDADVKTDDKKQTVLWDPVDWDRIERAAQVKSEAEHMDIGTIDIVRAGTRRYVEELIGPIQSTQ